MHEQTIKSIAETLTKSNEEVLSPGLLYGKMGIVVYFFHYARYTGDKSYKDYAIVLMKNIKEQLLQQHVINYADGLAGIGAAVEYLAQNNFVKVNTNEVLEEFDKKIFLETVYGERTNASLFTGLSGLGRYFLFRIAGNYANDNHIGTLNNKMSLIHITDTLERMCHTLTEKENEDIFRFLYAMIQTKIYPQKVKRLIKTFSKYALHLNQYDLMWQYQRKMEEFQRKKYNEYLSDILLNTHFNTVPSLYGGLAGVGLYLLSKLDKKHEIWMKLL